MILTGLLPLGTKFKTPETTLKWFRIRLVHIVLGTNVVLKHMGIENDSKLLFCRKERDTVSPLFWRCACVEQFWEQFQMAIDDSCPNAKPVMLNKNILLGHHRNFKSDNTLDLMILSAALIFSMYRCEFNRNTLQLYQFKRYLKTTLEADKYVAKLNMSHDKLVRDWHFDQTLVEV